MDIARENVLADAALACDENFGIACRCARRSVEHGLHGRAVAGYHGWQRRVGYRVLFHSKASVPAHPVSVPPSQCAACVERASRIRIHAVLNIAHVGRGWLDRAMENSLTKLCARGAEQDLVEWRAARARVEWRHLSCRRFAS